MEKLQCNLGGLRGPERKPDAIFVLDTKKEHIAVTEANKLGIPVVAVVDTTSIPSSCSIRSRATTTPSEPTRCWRE